MPFSLCSFNNLPYSQSEYVAGHMVVSGIESSPAEEIQKGFGRTTGEKSVDNFVDKSIDK